MVCVNRDGWDRPGVSIGNRIETSFGEGMTARETAQGQPGAAKEAETDRRNVGVFRAGGKVKAMGRAEGMEDWREDRFVDPEGDADGEGGFRVRHLGEA